MSNRLRLRHAHAGHTSEANTQCLLPLLGVSSRLLEDLPRVNLLDGVSLNVQESRRLVEAATSGDPEVGLTAVVALRQLMEILEELQVDNARTRAGRGGDIARRLGVTKQAVHYKHGLRLRRRNRRCGTG
jgi:hypothetical protein